MPPAGRPESDLLARAGSQRQVGTCRKIESSDRHPLLADGTLLTPYWSRSRFEDFRHSLTPTSTTLRRPVISAIFRYTKAA